MNFLDYNNSQTRFRADTAFKWCVWFSGVLVIVTFIALILTLVYRASPLLYSPQVNLSERLTLPTSHQILSVGQYGMEPIISYAPDPSKDNLCNLTAWNEQDLNAPVTTYSLKCGAGIKLQRHAGVIIAFYIDEEFVKAVTYKAGQFVQTPEFSRRLPQNTALASLSNSLLAERIHLFNDILVLDTPVGLWRSSVTHATEFQPVTGISSLSESVHSALILAQGLQLVFVQEANLVIQPQDETPLLYPITGELVRLQPSQQPNVFYAQVIAPNPTGQRLLSLIQFSLNHTEYSGLSLDAKVLLSMPYNTDDEMRIVVGENDIHNILNVVIDSATSSEFKMLNSVTGELLTAMPLTSRESAGEFTWFGRDGFVVGQGTNMSRFGFSQLASAITYNELFTPQTYIGYSQPAQHWQTNPSLDYQDRKYNVMPLLIGSAKVSLLALLVAIPLALGSAIYVGYFAPLLVQKTLKPFIEVLEAIPSVAIGLIAAVWLAPLAESFLLSFIVFICLLPLLLLVSHGIFTISKKLGLKHLFVRSELALQIVLILGLVWVCFIGLATPMGIGFVEYQTQVMPINKSTLVVGIAMWIAISPTIFSLAEDAISGVSRSMIKAAAALGATRVQTLTYILLPAAAPGLIAAMMIGLGRAFGETMIVLMVTGNTPIANWDIFGGLRALSANLVIELPEANQTNSHLTVLFITALLLFMFTFCLNSIAELIKHQQAKTLRGTND